MGVNKRTGLVIEDFNAEQRPSQRCMQTSMESRLLKSSLCKCEVLNKPYTSLNLQVVDSKDLRSEVTHQDIVIHENDFVPLGMVEVHAKGEVVKVDSLKAFIFVKS